MGCEITAPAAWHIAALEAQVGGAVEHYPGEQEDYALGYAGGYVHPCVYVANAIVLRILHVLVPAEYDSWMTRAGLSERGTI